MTGKGLKLPSEFLLSVSVLPAMLAAAGGAHAQTSTDVLTDNIVVTGTKKADGEDAQEAPVSIAAFGADQLDALFVTNFTDLTFREPNIVLDDIGSFSGAANFSIRGLGINASIPSIDPTVGLFVDGVYLGVTSGVIFDIFDLEGIEILRGPQGLLFGRNVTGGAVLINTADPADEFTVKAKATLETGLNQIYQASISGPIAGDTLKGKVSVFYRDDEGYFRNTFNDTRVNGSETVVIRAAATLAPAEDLELKVKFEHGEIDGDGQAIQNRALIDDGFDVNLDLPGFIERDWNQITAEANWNVPFGDGVITNIFGWREFESKSLFDTDGTPQDLLRLGEATAQDQISNELRYSGRLFDSVDLTAGVFYFTQDLAYQEVRFIFQGPTAPNPPGPAQLYGGGIQDSSQIAVFGQAGIDITDRLALDLGLRWSREEKEILVATLLPGPASPDGFSVPAGACDILANDCVYNVNADPTFDPNIDFSNVTPKVGLRYALADNARLYAHWTRGFRAGGYNLRNTSPVAPPGPFDDERVDAYEIGLKSEPLEGRAVFNAAFFLNKVDDLQRSVIFPDPVSGIIQIIDNTADATILGFELDSQILLVDNLLFTGAVGFTDAEYDRIVFDISGDAVVDDTDLALELPRAPRWTYNFGLTYDYDLGELGFATAQVNFSHRDASFYDDANTGPLSAADILDASLSFNLGEGGVKFSVYGKNLLDEVTERAFVRIPFPFGSTNGSSTPINKGRVFGGEIQVEF